MRQYYPCFHNNNNNNNNNKDNKDKNMESKKERRGEGEREFNVFLLLFVSFLDLWKSDRRFSSGLKAKLIHAARATRGYQNLGVSSNSTR